MTKRANMRRRFDRLITAYVILENGQDLPSHKRLEQYRFISEELNDWGTAMFPDESYNLYQMFKEHGILPYAGAWMDQPWFVRHDFNHWRMVEQWHRINETLSDTTGLPTVEEFIERSNGHHE